MYNTEGSPPQYSRREDLYRIRCCAGHFKVSGHSPAAAHRAAAGAPPGPSRRRSLPRGGLHQPRGPAKHPPWLCNGRYAEGSCDTGSPTRGHCKGQPEPLHGAPGLGPLLLVLGTAMSRGLLNPATSGGARLPPRIARQPQLLLGLKPPQQVLSTAWDPTGHPPWLCKGGYAVGSCDTGSPARGHGVRAPARGPG